MFFLRQQPRVSGRTGISTTLPEGGCRLHAPWFSECVMTRSEYVGRLSPFRLRAIIEMLYSVNGFSPVTLNAVVSPLTLCEIGEKWARG